MERRRPLVADPEKLRAWRRRSTWNDRRGRRRPGWAEAKQAVRWRSRGLCEVRSTVCTGRAQGPPHHVLMRSQGGRDDPANLLDACRACHRYVHDHPEDSYQRRWLRRGRGSPHPR